MLSALMVCELMTCPGVPTAFLRSVRGVQCFGNFASAAEALERVAAFDEGVYGGVMGIESGGLDQRCAIPLDAQQVEIVGLGRYVFGPRRHAVEIFKAQDKAAAGASSAQPRHEGRPKIAEMKLPGRRRSKSTGSHCPIVGRKPDRRLFLAARLRKCA